MKKVLLLGNQITHSLSPKMHNAAFEYLKINLNYEVRYIQKNKFESEFKKIIQDKTIIGANITSPFKVDVIPFIKTSYPAVNTIVRNPFSFSGFNTDIFGVKTFLEELGYKKGFKSLILGKGGAAVAAKLAIKELNSTYVIRSRSDLRWNEIESIASTVDVVINATGSDNLNFNWGNIPLKVVAIDFRYFPSKTEFLNGAEFTGHKAFNGLKILLYQGVKSFEIWTGKKAPVDYMAQTIGIP